MKIHGIELEEGAKVVNIVVDSGSAFPSLPDAGELFYRTDESTLYIHSGTAWQTITRIENDGNKVDIDEGADQIEFTTGNVLRAIIDSSGNFIVGTPTGSLGVEIVRATTSTDFGLAIRNTSTGDAKLTLSTSVNHFSLGMDNSDSDYLKLSTSNTDVGASTLWTITNDGSLGINTVPSSKLHIEGSASSTGGLTVSNTTDATSAQLYTLAGGVTRFHNDGSGSNLIVFRSGTTNNFSITSNQVQVNDGGTAATPGYAFDGDNDTGVYRIAADILGISTNGVLRLSIDANGIDFNSLKGIDVADPTNPQDAATKNYVDTTTQPLDAALTSIAGLTTTSDQVLYTTAADTYTPTSITLFGRNLIADADATEGRDTLGLNAGGSGDIWVEKAGDTMTGFLTLSGTPTSDLHAATKAYVDSLAAGLDPKASAKGTTSSDIGGTYNASGGPSGTGSFTGVDLTSDAIFDNVPSARTYQVGDRIVIKDQTTQTENGIYSVSTAGASGVLIRATDHDGTPSNEVSSGNTIFVELGDSNGTTYALQGDGTLTLNVDNIVWETLSSAQEWIWGVGLTATGNTVNLTADLSDLQNVNDTGAATGDFLYKSAGNWLATDGITWDSSTQSMLFSSGTVTNPSISFVGDVDTGIYSPTANHIYFTTGGTNHLQLMSSGGIRASKGAFEGINGTASTPSFSFANDPNTGIFRSGADELALSTAGTERLRIDSIGNVGIGTTNPQSRLNVTGPGAEIRITSNDTASADLRTFVNSIESGKLTWDGSNFIVEVSNSERMRIDSSGNVGIGLTNPNDVLSVNGAITSVGNSTSFASGPSRAVIDWDSGNAIARVGAISGTGSTNALTFFVGETERMRLTSAGRLGIGTNNPSELLTLNSSSGNACIDFNDGSGSLSQICGGTVVTAGDSELLFKTQSGAGALTTQMVIDHNGNVGIGTTSPNCKLEVIGEFCATTITGVSYAETSTSGSTSIVDTSILAEPGIYEITIIGNPNTSGSSLYRDVMHLTAYITIGLDGVVTKYINVIEEFTRGSLHGSGGGPLVGDIVLWDGATEYTEVAESTSVDIRVKVSGYSGTVGANQSVKIKKIH